MTKYVILYNHCQRIARKKSDLIFADMISTTTSLLKYLLVNNYPILAKCWIVYRAVSCTFCSNNQIVFPNACKVLHLFVHIRDKQFVAYIHPLNHVLNNIFSSCIIWMIKKDISIWLKYENNILFSIADHDWVHFLERIKNIIAILLVCVASKESRQSTHMVISISHLRKKY